MGCPGVVGILHNGTGATVLLRADMDALAVTETTGLPYASTATGTNRFGDATGIAHACGHDMHTTCLMGAVRLLAENRGAWQGTVLAVFQPAEETGQGARGMIEDGLVKRFPKPDVTLAQHVVAAPAGTIGWNPTTIMSAGDSWEVMLFGRGAHGSRPQSSVDPVVMASSAVTRLQGIVSREVAPNETAVVTVGALQAGIVENVIPDHALLRLNVRTFKDQVCTRVLAAIHRILDAEAAASGAPQSPAYSVLSEFPRTDNDSACMLKVAEAFGQRFGSNAVQQVVPATASEDFSLFGAAWGAPVIYWMIGGVDPETFAAAEKAGTVDQLPINHSPNFAPVIEPTLQIGISTLLTAAGVWL
jgi:amidohydrolase